MKPPSNDPLLASYQSPEYNRRLVGWGLMADVYEGNLNDIANPEKYLPRESSEPLKAYNNRLVRSPFDNHLAPIIQKFSGALSTLSVKDMNDAVDEVEDNIDLCGNSLMAFFDMADQLALRDGHCFILVDYCSTPTISRPFLRLIDVKQVINWEEVDGLIDRLTISEMTSKRLGYGSTDELTYRVIEGDTWKTIRLVEGAPGKWREEETGAGQFFSAEGTPLSLCPVIPYSLSSFRWSQEHTPLFYSLAKLNIRLYQSQSDCWEIIHKCNCPVPCVAVGAGSNLLDELGNLSLGANDFLDLGLDGKAFYLQPSGASIDNAVASIDRILEAIKEFDLMASLKTVKGEKRTATEVRMAFSGTQKYLGRLAQQKESSIESLMEVLGLFMGIKPEDMGSILVAADVSALLTDENSITTLYEAGLLSLESAVTRLNQLGFNQDTAEELLLLRQKDGAMTSELVAKLSPPTDYN